MNKQKEKREPVTREDVANQYFEAKARLASVQAERESTEKALDDSLEDLHERIAEAQEKRNYSLQSILSFEEHTTLQEGFRNLERLDDRINTLRKSVDDLDIKLAEFEDV